MTHTPLKEWSGQSEPPDRATPPTPHYGPRNTHKPLKAIIGIAILIVLSFLFYQFGGK